MYPLQDCKWVSITPPGAIVDNASYVTAEVNTIGYDYITIVIHLGATDIAMVALKVQESDVSGSGFADVTGLVFGTSNNDTGSASTLPSATDDNKFFEFSFPLKGRKQYIDVVATAGDGVTGTYLTALAILSRAKDGPRTAVERGLSQRLVA